MFTKIELLKRYQGELTPIQQQYRDLYVELGSYSKVSRTLNVHESTVRRSIETILQRSTAQQSTVPEHMNTPVPAPFTVEKYSANYDQDGNRRQHWIKANREKQALYDDMVIAMEDLAQELPQFSRLPRETKTVDPNLLAVYPLGDPHIGLLTYAPEVGQNWDLKIAEKMFFPLFEKLVLKAPPSDECLIIDLGDFWHYDGMEQKTMRSNHKVDADGRPSKMIQVGYRILLMMIRLALRVHKKVNVKIMPGNHDDLGSIFLRVSLFHIFEKEPRVNVDLSPDVFQYFSWGKNLFGIHHGDKCKMTQLPMVMAADQPELWGTSEFRKWFIGHFHHDASVIFNGKELQGCTAEIFRTIVATEGYAHEAGYRSGQDGKVIIFHKDHGEVERYTQNISQVR